MRYPAPQSDATWPAHQDLTPADQAAKTPEQFLAQDDKIKLVAFCSVSCEASLQQLQVLQKFVATAPTKLALLAVHIPKYDYDREPEAVANLLSQHGINTPTIIDESNTMANQYGVDIVPSTVLIDQAGLAVGMYQGTASDTALADLLATKSLLTSQDFARRSSDQPGSETARPAIANITDISIAANGSELLVTLCDTGNDRVLVGHLTLGAANSKHLSATEAQLNIFHQIEILSPTAACQINSSVIAICSQTANNVQLVDLGHETKRSPKRQNSGATSSATEKPTTRHMIAFAKILSRPSAMITDKDGSLVIADAVQNQIFRILFHKGSPPQLGLIAGTGALGSISGRAAHAELAQPVALARTQAGIVFCEAASSTVRLLADDGTIHDVTRGGLTEFGANDGAAHYAKMQRPSSLTTFEDGTIIVADTGNQSLRLIRNTRVSTVELANSKLPTQVAAVPQTISGVADHNVLLFDAASKGLQLVNCNQTKGRTWPLSVTSTHHQTQ